MHKHTRTRTNYSAGVGAHAGKTEVPRPFSASLPRGAEQRFCCHCSICERSLRRLAGHVYLWWILFPRWPPGRLSGAQKAPNEFLVVFGDVAPANFGPWCVCVCVCVCMSTSMYTHIHNIVSKSSGRPGLHYARRKCV